MARVVENNIWTGFSDTATADTFVKIIDFDTTRQMLKIHNRSHDKYLKVAFSEEDAMNDICIAMCPDGLFDQTNFCPTNEIWVAGEGADVVVNWWLDQRDLIKFDLK